MPVMFLFPALPSFGSIGGLHSTASLSRLFREKGLACSSPAFGQLPLANSHIPKDKESKRGNRCNNGKGPRQLPRIHSRVLSSMVSPPEGNIDGDISAKTNCRENSRAQSGKYPLRLEGSCRRIVTPCYCIRPGVRLRFYLVENQPVHLLRLRESLVPGQN